MTLRQAWQDEGSDPGGRDGGRLWGRSVSGLASSGEGQICYVRMTMKKRA